MHDPILDNLNPQQLAAVTAPDGPLMIVAGAGTGKTRVITRRLAHLVRDRGVRPWQIFATTFTNKAAGEMKARVATLTTGICAPEFNISTFHSMCARILRRQAVNVGLEPNFTICDEKDQISALKQVFDRLGITDQVMKPADAQHVINQCKMRMLGPDLVHRYNESLDDIYPEVYAAYQKLLRESGSVDFEDLILLVVQLFQTNAKVLEEYQNLYRYLMVDEYQDTNLVQVELVSLLAAHHRNLAVVGDEDQSIYSWRGADMTNLLDFQKHFPEAQVVRLEQNYRSTGNILLAASTVIANNKERLGKTLFTSDGSGSPIYIVRAATDKDEANAVAYAMEDLRERGYKFNEMAVFYRLGALSRNMEEALLARRIPYRVIGGVQFYKRAEIKDAMAYLQVVANPRNSLAFLRIINTPKRGIGQKTVESLISLSSSEGMSLFQAISVAVSRGDFPRATAARLARLASQVEEWIRISPELTPSRLLERILDEINYETSLGDPKNLEVRARLENLDELINSIRRWEDDNASGNLNDFLEMISLTSVTDEIDENDDHVNLMTLHAAKGLEFRAAFIIGMNDELFPSLRAVSERGDFEEERRLFYVGITRAREILTLSFCQSRYMYGEPRMMRVSGFLTELPEEILSELDSLNPSFDPSAQSAAHVDEAPVQPTEPRNWAERQLRQRRNFQPAPVQPRPAVPPTGGKYKPGTRVRHDIFGDGIITGVKLSGRDQQLFLETDDGSTYQLLAKYARLEILSE